MSTLNLSRTTSTADDFEFVIAFALPDEDDPWGVNVEEAREAYLQNGCRERGGFCTCDLCGASYKRGALLLHLESGKLVSVGHTCAETVAAGLLGPRWSALLAATKANRERHERAVASALQKARKRDELRDWLRSLSTKQRELLRLARHTRVGLSLREDAVSRGGLTPAQLEFALLLGREELHRRLAPPAATAWPFPAGRQRVTATILGIRQRDFDLGPKWRLAVDTPAGRVTLWGGCPSAIADGRFKWAELVGCEVAFDAALEPSDSDPAFGFAKRPTKLDLSKLPERS